MRARGKPRTPGKRYQEFPATGNLAASLTRKRGSSIPRSILMTASGIRLDASRTLEQNDGQQMRISTKIDEKLVANDAAGR